MEGRAHDPAGAVGAYLVDPTPAAIWQGPPPVGAPAFSVTTQGWLSHHVAI